VIFVLYLLLFWIVWIPWILDFITISIFFIINNMCQVNILIPIYKFNELAQSLFYISIFSVLSYRKNKYN
jgi:hypothetical protein